MQKEIEIIKDDLSYGEELECIAKRFGMTQEQTLKEIIHVEYDADGRIIFDDNSCRELDLSDSDTAF